jgi:hypothetical protein
LRPFNGFVTSFRRPESRVRHVVVNKERRKPPGHTETVHWCRRFNASCLRVMAR